MAEHLNPFWFVPMAKVPPPTLSLPQWAEVGGPLLSGRVRVRLRALTELHVAGRIDSTGGGNSLRMTQRLFYRRTRDGRSKAQPVVDGSTLRGCVRSYLEALTNSVAAIYNVGYETGLGYKKAKDERHIGFWVGHPPDANASEKVLSAFHAMENDRYLHGDREGQHVVNHPPHAFKRANLGRRVDGDLSDLKLDPATAIFGIVATEETSRRKAADGSVAVHGIAGRVRFEDAWFEPGQIVMATSLDIAGKSSFGAPNPRKSSWWYFLPDRVRPRRATLKSGNVITTAEFVGSQLRGRKVYFHHDPKKTFEWYRKHWVIPGASQAPLVEVPTEVIRRGEASAAFHVHFDRLPEKLVRLLLAGLAPSRNVRHKTGALRAFGFGSVAFEVEAVEVQRTGPASLDLTGGAWQVDEALTAAAQGRSGEVPEETLSVRVGDETRGLCSVSGWKQLRLVQSFPANLDQQPIFTYPPYRQGKDLSPLQKGFAHPVSDRDANLRGVVPAGPDAEDLLDHLADRKIKEAIDLGRYQMTAAAYKQLRKTAGLE